MNPRKIYVASSWHNGHQPSIVNALRRAGHNVFYFHNPAAGFRVALGWEGETAQ